MKFSGKTHKYKFQSFLKLIQGFIVHFIWDEMDINESYDGFKWLFKKDSRSLHKLFDLYTNHDNNYDNLLGKKEWKLMIKNIFEKGSDKTAFKKGGKPSNQDIIQSFELSKTINDEYNLSNKLSYNELEKALQNLAHKLYKKKPKSRYVKFSYEDRLEKLLLWATTLKRT